MACGGFSVFVWIGAGLRLFGCGAILYWCVGCVILLSGCGF